MATIWILGMTLDPLELISILLLVLFLALDHLFYRYYYSIVKIQIPLSCTYDVDTSRVLHSRCSFSCSFVFFSNSIEINYLTPFVLVILIG